MCTTLMLGSSLVATPPLKERRRIILYVIPVFIVNLIQETCCLICPKAKGEQELASGVAQSTNKQSPFKKRCTCPHGLSAWSSPTRLQHLSCPLGSWIGSCVIAVSMVVCWDHESCWEEAFKAQEKQLTCYHYPDFGNLAGLHCSPVHGQRECIKGMVSALLA